MFKILGSEAAANTTPSQFANNRVIRLANKGTAAIVVTLWENAQPVNLTINASANATTLLTLTPGSGNTANVVANMRIFGSSNLAVVNTVVASQVASIQDANTFIANVDIIIANGVAQVFVTNTSKTFTMIPNSEFIIEKSRTDFISSANNADIVAMPVTYRG